MDNITISARIRPILNSEIKNGDISCTNPSPDGTKVQIKVSPNNVHSYHCSHCFGKQVSQVQFFQQCGLIGLLDAALRGRHVSAFCFGQTASGKTYTMFGGQRTNMSRGVQRGLISRSIEYLSQQLAESGVEFSLKLSCVEIFHEEVFDLIAASNKPFEVIEDEKGEYYIQGLQQVACSSYHATEAVVEKLRKIRRTDCLDVRSRSNRSHCLTDICIEMIPEPGAHAITSRVSLVDLAGSEALHPYSSLKAVTGKNKDVLREEDFLTRSLYVLGKVIADCMLPAAQQEVKFTASTLTRLLHTAIGDHASTLFIPCIKEAKDCVLESVRTLQYSCVPATKPPKYMDPQTKLIHDLKVELGQLTNKNKRLREHIRMSPAWELNSNSTISIELPHNQSVARTGGRALDAAYNALIESHGGYKFQGRGGGTMFFPSPTSGRDIPVKYVKPQELPTERKRLTERVKPRQKSPLLLLPALESYLKSSKNGSFESSPNASGILFFDEGIQQDGSVNTGGASGRFMCSPSRRTSGAGGSIGGSLKGSSASIEGSLEAAPTSARMMSSPSRKSSRASSPAMMSPKLGGSPTGGIGAGGSSGRDVSPTGSLKSGRDVSPQGSMRSGTSSRRQTSSPTTVKTTNIHASDRWRVQKDHKDNAHLALEDVVGSRATGPMVFRDRNNRQLPAGYFEIEPGHTPRSMKRIPSPVPYPVRETSSLGFGAVLFGEFAKSDWPSELRRRVNHAQQERNTKKKLRQKHKKTNTSSSSMQAGGNERAKHDQQEKEESCLEYDDPNNIYDDDDDDDDDEKEVPFTWKHEEIVDSPFAAHLTKKAARGKLSKDATDQFLNRPSTSSGDGRAPFHIPRVETEDLRFPMSLVARPRPVSAPTAGSVPGPRHPSPKGAAAGKTNVAGADDGKPLTVESAALVVALPVSQDAEDLIKPQQNAENGTAGTSVEPPPASGVGGGEGTVMNLSAIDYDSMQPRFDPHRPSVFAASISSSAKSRSPSFPLSRVNSFNSFASAGEMIGYSPFNSEKVNISAAGGGIAQLSNDAPPSSSHSHSHLRTETPPPPQSMKVEDAAVASEVRHDAEERADRVLHDRHVNWTPPEILSSTAPYLTQHSERFTHNVLNEGADGDGLTKKKKTPSVKKNQHHHHHHHASSKQTNTTAGAKSMKSHKNPSIKSKADSAKSR